MAHDHTRQLEFAAYLEQYQSQLFGYIHSLVRNLNDADDLFQQTTLVLWKKFTDFDRSRSFLAWACGVARFEIANFLRSRSRHHLYFSDELNLLLIEAHEELRHEEIEDRREALAQCAGKLRDSDRELLADCYGEASDIPQAAQRRGRSPQSVYNSLRRIRRALFECIRRTLDHESGPELLA